eukprot:6181890-Pleurochrysis_carterae.AAC.1
MFRSAKICRGLSDSIVIGLRVDNAKTFKVLIRPIVPKDVKPELANASRIRLCTFLVAGDTCHHTSRERSSTFAFGYFMLTAHFTLKQTKTLNPQSEPNALNRSQAPRMFRKVQGA